MITIFLKRKKTIIIAFLTAMMIVLSAILYSATINQRKIIPVPYLSQRGTLDSGCELISAIMVLRYYGCAVSIDDFVSKVPTSPLISTPSGFVGESPTQSFIGDPRSSNGLGCYAPVVSLAMNAYLPRVGKRAIALSGTDFDVLLSRYLARGTPVILWATSNMVQPGSGPRWTIRETGETFQWIGGEHCLVLIGNDQQNCYFRDPYKPNGAIPFDRGIVERRYHELGSQAVVVQ